MKSEFFNEIWLYVLFLIYLLLYGFGYNFFDFDFMIEKCL